MKEIKIKNLSNFALFAALFIALLSSLYGVNLSNKLVICSHFFVFSLLISLIMAEVFGKKLALYGVLACLAFTVLLCWPLLKWMHVFSFFGLFFALYTLINSSALQSIASVPLRIFLSLSCGILIDAVVMIPWELAVFPVAKFWDVLFRSLFYKFSNTCLISLCALVLYAFKDNVSSLAKIEGVWKKNR